MCSKFDPLRFGMFEVRFFDVRSTSNAYLGSVPGTFIQVHSCNHPFFYIIELTERDNETHDEYDCCMVGGSICTKDGSKCPFDYSKYSLNK